ncbi:nuclear transport factor 2 family protein [Sphingomonas gei]|uniref:Nuclear transport factor 2 family protein n=1 Tax=Sphingomonas gei TaxID=1395960 RepID=A0A4S1X717_9SPHN|nr:nuclear transport factor 2 family protein [Sphingomonas gei]
MIGPFAFALLLAPAPVGADPAPPAQSSAVALDKELIDLSRQKWLWMADKNVDALARLFDDKAIFVHMSRTMTKPEELEVIKGGNIEYRRADIKEISVRFIGDTAIVLSRIDLHAIVRGNVADNPFSVTETYVKKGGEWKLGALAFSRLATPN